ncbi:MFS transporter [Candidatus Bathyarchaeota archaeon]|nr:MFS transporter [Candidatus Bathyarchaeota archaeon]MBT4423908.1 MFS transporter [Candidatus Bathyarchaeota archaeon]MBT6604953.1 MFS transporter [Candidatus Bathyarchaeota archaeon]MBT7187506.1 MFS transporter [Candidatus Bathyarchaeota archaeon]MBT7345756.1 MFS transporter [Candidatus Bathyarchaeota archaeon]
MSEKKQSITELVKGWAGFLQRQESPFKVNIMRNLVKNLAVNLTFQYQPIYMTSLGATPLILGYLNSISGAVNTVLSIPTGILADKVGIKRVLLLTLGISILSTLVFGVANTWQVAAVGLILSAVAFILDRTSCPMICGSTLGTEERVTGMGICDTVTFFPQMIAPIIGATLITYFGGMNAQGIKPLYWIQVVGLVVSFIIVWAKFTNPRQLTVGEKSSVFSNISNVFKEGTMVKRWILLTMVSSFWWQVAFYIPLYAADIKGAGQFIVGGMSAASTVVFVLLAIPLGHLADTWGRKKMITVAGGIIVLSYISLIYAPNDLVLILSGFLSGFAMTVGQTQMAIAVDLVPKKYMGSWFGLLGFFRGLVSIISPIVCGYLWSNVSPESVFWLIILTQIGNIGMLYTVPTSITR